ncbi:MAG: Dam family site-specific DNA-(adenine-N6)-methyltransferase [Defluviitaleaceae bacterium]|nr:Dam family site-specific DNA-(adenine-N6)-methyltransferase [Defluviitaleaceae bacterium]
MRYIGGKSQLLGEIQSVINENAEGGERVFCDIFSGTGVVARHFKPQYEVHANDMLHFSYVLQKATIENNEIPMFAKLGVADPIKYLEEATIPDAVIGNRLIADNYAPNENCNRMYISEANAKRVDFIRNTIEKWASEKLINEAEYYYLLASLIEGIPFVSNITGTYGAYLKNWDRRALKAFEMVRLDIVNNGFANKSYNQDANKLIMEIEGDILYIDPPYNARQYAPNYHLLETISRYDNPEIKGVTGMRPYDDLKSDFCSKAKVLGVFEDLIAKAKFPNIVMSYSAEGLMTASQIEDTLKRFCIDGSFKRYDIAHRKYRSKIAGEEKTVKEHIFYARKNLPRTSVFTIKSAKANEGKYLKSPLNYIGGKYKLLPQILPLFPPQINTFVDLFAGGCNVGINVPANHVICNDLNTKIIDMYGSFLALDTDEVIQRIKSRIAEFNLSKTNEQGFIDFRNYYNRTKDPIDLYTLACYSFNYQFRFNNNLEYNNPFGRNRSQFSENMRENLLAFMTRIKNKNISFTAQDFINVDLSNLGEGDMVYCDPPYYITTGSYNDGNRGFKDWKEQQEHDLYATLDRLHQQGVKIALSNVLEHKGARNEILLEWCKKYFVIPLKHNYSNSSYNTQKGESLEVLVVNYQT